MPSASRRRLAELVALVVVASAAAGCGDGGDSRLPQGMRSGPTIATTVDSAVFTVDCAFSHRAPDDPIVHPGEPGASHVHDFFGADSADAHSTTETLRAGGTTCEDREDLAAYWAPALYVGREPVRPVLLRAYYRAAVGADVTEVQPLPDGIQLLAGVAHPSPGQETPVEVAGWGCGQRPRRLHRRPPGDCTPSSPLTLRLVFPDCWDGRRVSSDDHVSHAAHSERGRCPRSHPVPILQVQVSIAYDVWAREPDQPGPRADRLVLASGGWETTHGDFFNAWDPDRLAHRTRLCVRAMANCTIG
jgi:hypothetical protein